MMVPVRRRPRMPVSVLVICLLLAMTGLACRRPRVDGTVNADPVLKSWSEAGFDTKGVVSIEPDAWSAGACSRGLLAGLDVLICEYSSDEAAKVGEKKISGDWEEESIPTGALVRTSNTLLAIADRNKADRPGRTITRLAKLFRDQR